jgi:hypothetical protein
MDDSPYKITAKKRRTRKKSGASLGHDERRKQHLYQKLLARAGFDKGMASDLPLTKKTESYKISGVAKHRYDDILFMHPRDKYQTPLDRPTSGGKLRKGDRVKFKHLMPAHLKPQEPDPKMKPRDHIASMIKHVKRQVLTTDTHAAWGGIRPKQHGPPGTKSDDTWTPLEEALGADDYFNYVGQWKESHMQGLGDFRFAIGGNYHGHWDESKQSGHGTAHYRSGSSFEGDWVNGRTAGKGTQCHAGGYKYEGQWSNGLRHGEGTLTYPSGQVYKGTFERGNRHGRGEMTNRYGYKYVGLWEDGYICGTGALVFPDGKRHVRTWPVCTFAEAITIIMDEERAAEEEQKRRMDELMRIENEEKLLDVVDDAMEKLAAERAAEEEARNAEMRREYLEKKKKMEEAKQAHLERLMEELGITDDDPPADGK